MKAVAKYTNVSYFKCERIISAMLGSLIDFHEAGILYPIPYYSVPPPFKAAYFGLLL